MAFYKLPKGMLLVRGTADIHTQVCPIPEIILQTNKHQPSSVTCPGMFPGAGIIKPASVP